MSRVARRGRRAACTASAALAIVVLAAAVCSGAEPPAPVVRTLENGLTVAVFPDTRLAIVQVQILVPAGAVHEPTGESGVASLTAQMLGQTTASRSAERFAAAVEDLGGSVGGSASRDFTTVSGAFLSGDFEAGLELLADAVIHPIFAEEQMRVVKGHMAGSLARARQNPQAIADELLWAEVYPGHPFGRSPLGAQRTLPALTASQLRAFHRDHYRPDRALLAIAGDVTPERAFKEATALFGAWGGRAHSAPLAAPARPDSSGWRVRIVDAPGMTRAELRIGAAGPARGAADHLALEVAGEVLNAALPGPRARLHALRETGLFAIALTTPVDSAAAATARVREALERWTSSAPGGPELAAVKRRMAGSHALAFETRGGWIAQWMSAAYSGHPPATPAAYADRVEALDTAAVRDAAARWVAPGSMVLVAVGPAERLRPQLESLGTVETVLPEAAGEAAVLSPSTESAPPTEAQLARGRELAGRMIAAHGGIEALRRIKDSTMEGAMTIHAGDREFSGDFMQVRKEPMRFLFSTQLGVLKTVQGLDGERGWSRAGDQPAVEEQDSVTIAAMKSAFRTDLHHLLLMAADPGTRAAWRGREHVGEREVDVLELVAADGARRVFFLDPTHHRMVAMEQGEGGHSARRLYGDLRPVGGVQWPFQEQRLLDGRPAMTLTLRRVAFNTGVRDEAFRRPGATSGPRPRPR